MRAHRIVRRDVAFRLLVVFWLGFVVAGVVIVAVRRK